MSIIIPGSVTSIGVNAFSKCRILSSIVIPLKFRAEMKLSSIFHSSISLARGTLLNNSEIYGVMLNDLYKLEYVDIKSPIDRCEGITEKYLKYEIVDMNTRNKMEYALWLMAIDMNDYIDDWKGPHSLLVTSYLFGANHVG